MAKPNIAALEQRMRQLQAAKPKPLQPVAVQSVVMTAGQKAVATKRANGQIGPGTGHVQAVQTPTSEIWLAVTEEPDRLVCQPVAIGSEGNTAQWSISASVQDGVLVTADLLVSVSECTPEQFHTYAMDVGRLNAGMLQDRAESEDSSFSRSVARLVFLARASRIILQPLNGSEGEIGRGEAMRALDKLAESFLARVTKPAKPAAAA